MQVTLTEQELEILIDHLPASYKPETPKEVTALKLKLMGLKEQ
jgi:hypothetical protein